LCAFLSALSKEQGDAASPSRLRRRRWLFQPRRARTTRVPAGRQEERSAQGQGRRKSKSKEPAKTKTPPEKAKLPKDAIIIVMDNIVEAIGMFSGSITMSLEEYNNLKDRVKELERQLKTDKKIPFSCRLEGKLDGDFMVLRVRYSFSTERPKTTVPARPWRRTSYRGRGPRRAETIH